MKIIMLGAPGAGKGTQAKQIAQAYDIPHISTGDIFRANIKEGTELGKKAQEYMDKGLLVPDELVCDLVVDRIHKDDCEKGYILDGFPRTIPQANALDEALAKDGEKIEFAIDIEVPDENIINRMSGRRSCKDCGAIFHVQYNPPKKENCCYVCGGELILRDDDKAETVKKRLDVYHEQTAPLIAHYKEAGSLHEIDGTQAVSYTHLEQFLYRHFVLTLIMDLQKQIQHMVKSELKHGFTMVKYFHQKRKGEINNVNAKKSKTS